MTGLDFRTGPTPGLVAEDVERLLRAMDSRPMYGRRRSGAGDVARGFGLSVKSVYRYWPGRVEWVEVDGYRVAFLCRPGFRPVLLRSRREPRPASLDEKLS